MDIDGIKTKALGNSPVVYQLGLWAFTASVLDSISDQGTKISQATQYDHSKAKQKLGTELQTLALGAEESPRHW